MIHTVDSKTMARELGVDVRTLMRQVHRGKIPVIRMGKRFYRFHVSSVISNLQGSPVVEDKQ